MIDGRQCRSARAWLRLEAQDLARAVGVQPITIQRFERGTHIPRPDTLDAIRHELEKRGIRFNFAKDGKPIGIEEGAW